MKLYMLFLLSCLALGLMIADAEGAPRIQDASITVTTMTATAIPALPGRKYFLSVNESGLYTVRIATWSIDMNAVAKATGARGIPVPLNFGSYEETGFVSPNAWYVIIDSATAPADTVAISATVSVREKD